MKTPKAANAKSAFKRAHAKINQLARIAPATVSKLQRAFAEWQDGDIYVCKKTGTYRFRFGKHTRAVTPWSALALETFTSPDAFAFAAMVLAPEVKPEPVTKAPAKPRANVIELAKAA